MQKGENSSKEKTVPGTVFCSTGGLWDSSLRNIVRGVWKRLKKGGRRVT
jgi:hypothetical protein